MNTTLEGILNGYFNYTPGKWGHWKPMFRKNGRLSVVGNRSYDKMIACLQELSHYFPDLASAKGFFHDLNNIGISDGDDFLSIVDTCDKITHEKE